MRGIVSNLRQCDHVTCFCKNVAGLIAAALVVIGCTNQDVAGPSGDVVEISGDIAQDLVLKADKDYLLTGQTFVKPGVTLTIEPGTTIKGLPYDKIGRASVLVIEPGAWIVADGTVDKPITFTCAFDESVLPQRGLWGGLIILGNAPVNQSGGTAFVEGVAGIPFGGEQPDDSSGILRYVRVWYGGREIGEGNEINGITFAGVGRRTIVEYCEVAWNNDDGFEFFGGTVDAKYLSAIYCGDDCFDTDWGYQGRGQFFFGLLGRDVCGRGFEMDNDGKNMDGQPRSCPTFSNVTLVGPGGGSPSGDGSDYMLVLREGTGGDFRNMVIVNGNGKGVRVKDQATLDIVTGTLPQNRLNSLFFSSRNIIHGCADSAFHDDVAGLLTIQSSDPTLSGIDQSSTSTVIDPRPVVGSTVFDSVDQPYDQEFFTEVDYKGAFSENLWLKGWSWLDENNRLP